VAGFLVKKMLTSTPLLKYNINKRVQRKAQTKSAKTPEGKVKLQVKNILNKLGSECWYFMPVTRGMSRNGIPDFIGCYKGRMFAIETKSIFSSHTLTSLQEKELDGIRRADGIALVINEDNMDTLVKLLTQE